VYKSSVWSAALKCCIEWNESLPANERCDILLLPSQENELVSLAAPAGGLFPIAMPPTHILDLRAYIKRGASLADFLATAPKKGARKDLTQAFVERGGSYEFVSTPTLAHAEQMASNSGATAALRSARAEPSMLCRPTPEFIVSLQTACKPAHCSVLLLHEPPRSVAALSAAASGTHGGDGTRSAAAAEQHDGLLPRDVIASSVIFQFPGSLLTSDIHGQLHEKVSRRPCHTRARALHQARTVHPRSESHPAFSPSLSVCAAVDSPNHSRRIL
jgi:hypothetical protein